MFWLDGFESWVPRCAGPLVDELGVGVGLPCCTGGGRRIGVGVAASVSTMDLSVLWAPPAKALAIVPPLVSEGSESTTSSSESGMGAGVQLR